MTQRHVAMRQCHCSDDERVEKAKASTKRGHREAPKKKSMTIDYIEVNVVKKKEIFNLGFLVLVPVAARHRKD